MTDHKKHAANVFRIESDAIAAMGLRLDEQFNKAVELIKNCKGRVIVSGMGKSGLIGKKIAATFNSTGIASFFLHPAEAMHGDLGLIQAEDVLLTISKSGLLGESELLITTAKRLMATVIALVGNMTSELADRADIVLDCSVEKEACLNNLAPTTSSTVALAMGDAMAVLYESVVNLSKEGFAKNHPGGLLGKSLVMKVRDLMWKKDQCPTLTGENTLRDAILEMTKNPAGACAILNEKNGLEGLLVEGDIRRNLAKSDQAINFKLKDIMTKSPAVTTADSLAYSALEIMETKERQIYVLPVLDNNEFVGFLRMHDLLKEGFSK